MSEKLIHVDGIGKILLKRSKKIRHISISIKPFSRAKVTIPDGVGDEIAFRFVREKKNWITKHIAKMKELEAMQTKFDESSNFSTRHFKLHLKKEQRSGISIRVSNGKINVFYPTVINAHSKAVQEAIREGIERALRVEAKQYLPGKVKQLSEKYGFKFNKLTLKNIKSRWGSCSRQNNINLSIHLMRLPDHLIDYVILHELVHTVHHNHSAEFWKKLNDIIGDSKILEKEFKKYRISIY
jgi:predicted metal-dependent hydrolase